MYRVKFVCTVMLLAGPFVFAQDQGKLKSGPKRGASMPGSFECMNVNGPAKGRPHCFVCTFGLNPSVLIFAKEPRNGKDQAFTDLLRKLDETAAEFSSRSFSVGVVIISPDARDSTNNPQPGSVAELNKDAEKGSAANKRIADQAKKLIDEAVKRGELHKRLTKRAAGFKNVLIGYVPEAPTGYDLNAKAEMTVIFYDRMKVIETFAYGPGAFAANNVKTIVDRVREELSQKKK